jgi:tripartite-type tricarboxylate transporter receptor subunit TctC
MKRRLAYLTAVLAGIVGALFAATSFAIEGPWMPERSVRIVVPFSAGGPTDTVARIIADEMSIILSKPVYVDNIGGGAGGRPGVLQFLKEATDGHTLLMGHMGTHGAAPALVGEIGYDPVADFKPVGLVAGTPMVVAVRNSLGVNDLKSLALYMRARGPTVRLGHAGEGTVSHAAALLLASTLHGTPTIVSYNGIAPALTDLAAGKIDILLDQVVSVAPLIAAGHARALAVTSRERSDILRDVPTSEESGFPALRVDAWSALFAARSTQDREISTLNGALTAALSTPNTRARLNDIGAVIPDERDCSPTALADLVNDEIGRWTTALFELR